MGLIIAPIFIVVFIIILTIFGKAKKGLGNTEEKVSARTLLGYSDPSRAVTYLSLVLLTIITAMIADNAFDLDLSQNKFNSCGSYGPSCDINLVTPSLIIIMAFVGWLFLSALEDLHSLRLKKTVSYKGARDFLLVVPAFFIAIGIVIMLVWTPIFHFAI
jgi:hypothetical protein